jgi:PPOX class probable F420-dependent enzyme
LPEAYALIREAHVASLATVDGLDRPHVVPICFVLNGEVIYTALDAKPKRTQAERLRRVRNIEANPQVQVLVDRYDEDWSRLAYVQLRGTAALLKAGSEHATAVRLLREKYPQYEAMALEQGPVIRIAVQQCVYWEASADAGNR